MVGAEDALLSEARKSTDKPLDIFNKGTKLTSKIHLHRNNTARMQ